MTDKSDYRLPRQPGTARPVEPARTVRRYQPTHLHRHMSVYQLTEAISSLVAEGTILCHQIGLSSQMEESDLHQWAEEREDAIGVEIAIMLGELESRALVDKTEIEIRDYAIAKSWHLCPGGVPGGAQVIVKRPGDRSAVSQGIPVPAQDRLNEGLAMLKVVWLALSSDSLDRNDLQDFSDLADATWQALSKIEDAKKGLAA